MHAVGGEWRKNALALRTVAYHSLPYLQCGQFKGVHSSAAAALLGAFFLIMGEEFLTIRPLKGGENHKNS